MEMNAYQTEAHKTSKSIEIGGSTLLYPALGLAEEAGEYVGKVKKLYRDDGGALSDERKAAMLLELGDVLWYLSESALQLGVSLSDIAALNIEKTHRRKANGTLRGSGDNR